MAIDKHRLQYLHAMGVQTWSARSGAASANPLSMPETVGSESYAISSESADFNTESSTLPPGDNVGNYNWDQLQGAVRQCIACGLHASRKNTVFGVGDMQADWKIVGEAPGADEDRQGEPFVGRAGQLLNNMLMAIGLKRQQVYIANILKCRPPNNRDPRSEEVLECEPYLKRQVELVNPKIILAVGRIAAHNLLKTESSLARLRGQCFYFGESNTPLVVTYHPAYLLRSPMEKRKAWQDLLFAQAVCRGDIK